MVSHRHMEGAASARPDPVVTAAMQVMTDLGPTRMTMAEVARRAGVSRMTVYRRYSSLAELTSDVLTAEIGDVLGRVLASSAPAATVREQVVSQTIAVVDALGTHTLLERVLQVDPQSLMPLVVERIGSGQQLLRRHLATHLAQGMACRGGDGSVRDADPDRLALIVLTMAQPFVVGVRPLGGEYPTAELLAELATALDRYLRTE